jgi:hypothetical protein
MGIDAIVEIMRTNLLAVALALVVGVTFAHAAGKGQYLRADKSGGAQSALKKMSAGEPLTVNDVLALHNSGKHSDSRILDYIQDHNYSFDLTSKQLAALQKSGINHKIIDYIVWKSDLNTFERAHYIGRDFDPLYTQMDPRQAAYADYPWHYRLFPQNRRAGIGAR